jgi:ABC-type dipeptide/oligopeptide/nickel transport system permease component
MNNTKENKALKNKALKNKALKITLSIMSILVGVCFCVGFWYGLNPSTFWQRLVVGALGIPVFVVTTMLILGFNFWLHDRD